MRKINKWIDEKLEERNEQNERNKKLRKIYNEEYHTARIKEIKKKAREDAKTKPVEKGSKREALKRFAEKAKETHEKLYGKGGMFEGVETKIEFPNFKPVEQKKKKNMFEVDF